MSKKFVSSHKLEAVFFNKDAGTAWRNRGEEGEGLWKEGVRIPWIGGGTTLFISSTPPPFSARLYVPSRRISLAPSL